MKVRHIAAIVLAGLCIASAIQAKDGYIAVQKAFDAVEMTNTQTSTSAAHDLVPMQPAGYFSLQLDVSGTGGLSRVDYQISNDGATFVTPTNGNPIVEDFTVGSGPASNGVDLLPIYPILGRYIRISATSTGRLALSGWFALQ